MNVQEIIDELKAQNITLRWDGADINWTAPLEIVPSDKIIELIKKNWDEIVKRIDGPPPEWLLSGTNIIRLTQGDCLGAMGRYPDNLVDLIVTDPPYGLKILGSDWDNIVPPISIWKECLRVLKPGGFAYIMSSTRQDVLARMIFNLQEAGFNTRNSSLYWVYKQGFPIRNDISKAIKRKINRIKNNRDEGGAEDQAYFNLELLAAEVKVAEGAYPGYNPKPAVEIIIIAQKPGDKKTSVEQFLSNKKGASWLDDCRHPYADELDAEQVKKNFTGEKYNTGTTWSKTKKVGNNFNEKGRFPANLLVSDDALGHKDSKYFSLDSWLKKKQLEGLNIDALEKAVQKTVPYLIVPKPSPKEKNFGCEDIISEQKDKKGKNYHPTVKPILLMNYLITMGSRKGELVLDPFCGSGTTCLAARLLKRPSIGIEKDPEYYKIAAARMRALTLATWDEEAKKDTQLNSENGFSES